MLIDPIGTFFSGEAGDEERLGVVIYPMILKLRESAVEIYTFPQGISNEAFGRKRFGNTADQAAKVVIAPRRFFRSSER
jgi:hypothetical protein